MTERTSLGDDFREGRDVCARWVTLHDDDSLSIAGQDLGPQVEKWFGATEYEFARGVAPEGVARLRELLGVGAGGDLLAAIRDRFNGPGASARLENFVKDSEIETTFWSRSGD